MSLEISIIIPTHNSSETITKCLISLLNQTFRNFELLIVDDGSLDNTLEVINKVDFKDINHTVLVNDERGVATARNKGIKSSKGKYVMFIDSDDFVHETYLTDFSLLTLGEEYDLIISGYQKYYAKTGQITNVSVNEYSWKLADFLLNVDKFLFPPILQGPCWKLFKKEIIEAHSIYFPTGIQYGEDTYFVLNYLEKCSTVKTIPVCKYIYIIYDKQTLSKSFNLDRLGIVNIHLDILGRISNNNQVLIKNQIKSRIMIDAFTKEIDDIFYNNSVSYKNSIVQLKSLAKYKDFVKALRSSKKIKIKYLYFLFKLKQYYLLAFLYKRRNKITNQ